MALFEKLSEDLKISVKSGDRLGTETLRFLISDIKNRRINLKKDLNDDEIIDVISSQIKKRKESILEFNKGGRSDLSEKTEKEIEILKNYLPKQMSKEEIVKIIEDAVAKAGASGMKDMGKVMSQVMPQVRGRADNKLVSELVKEKLQ